MSPNIKTYLTIISTTIFAFFILFMIAFIDRKKVKDNTYSDMYGVVVRIESLEDYSHNSFREPDDYYKILIRDLYDTTLFAVWPTNKEAYYNYKIGDTIHFDLINKSRYFRIDLK